MPLKWIALSAAVGAVVTWFVLNAGTAAPQPAAPVTAGAAAPTGAPAADPWPAPAAAAANATAVRATPRAEAPADVTTEAPLDDASLMRLATDKFGFDCPGIGERSRRRNGHIDITCTNGQMLRVYVMDGANPRVGPRPD